MEESKKMILIIEDEVKIVETIQAYLTQNGYDSLAAYDGEEGLRLFHRTNPDLVLLDLMLPKRTGEEVCSEIRRASRVPIIMVTAKIDELQKITGFNIGADDYITKPFSPRELIVRINSLLRRSDSGVYPLFSILDWNNHDLEIDLNAHTVRKAGEIINLTPKEFKLLCALTKYPNKIFTREELITIAMGEEYDGYDRTIDSHIKNIRSKIEDDSAHPIYIQTVRGVGYTFDGKKYEK